KRRRIPMKWLKRLFNKPQKTPSSGTVIRITDFLKPDRIVFFPAGPSKRQVLGNLLGTLDLPDPAAALKAILSREEVGSTVIAPGLALPHARISGINQIEAALGIS